MATELDQLRTELEATRRAVERIARVVVCLTFDPEPLRHELAQALADLRPPPSGATGIFLFNSNDHH